jgi:SWI/SNF-related matrix-associated actin-dependent regulator 1 of chromatin subfamily A
MYHTFCCLRSWLKLIKKLSFDFESKTKPLSHQIEAIEYVRSHENVALFDEQGLGKSKIVIDALSQNLKDKSIDGALIVCKKTLLYTWKNEIEKHSRLFAIVLDGTKRQRGRILITYGHFYIVNYESLIQEIELVTLLLKHKRFALVLDESQKIKNPESKTANALLSLRGVAVKRIIITGTPIANRPEDIWSQFFFLDGGVLLGSNFDSFKKQFKVELKGTQDLSLFEEKLGSLREKIGSSSLRRTKDILELPEKIYEDVSVEFAPKQRIAYDKARSEMYYEVSNDEGEKVEEDIENYLVKLLRLTQIASNPSLLDKDYNEEPGKFKVLDRIVRDITRQNEKVIVWTSFVGNVRSLRNRYKELGAQMLFGEIPIVERNIVVKKFMEDNHCMVLIANPAAAKEGLTLTAANNAVYLDRSFKMDDYLQSQDRIHRISQTKRCRIMKLIATGSIDEYTDEILEKKELIAKYALGDTERITNKRSYLTKEDLLRILGD